MKNIKFVVVCIYIRSYLCGLIGCSSSLGMTLGMSSDKYPPLGIKKGAVLGPQLQHINRTCLEIKLTCNKEASEAHPWEIGLNTP